MADVKISALPAAAAAAATDEYPSNQSGTTRKITNAQIYSFSLASLNAENPLMLAGGAVSINADGSATFSNANIILNLDGSADFAGGSFQVLAAGDCKFNINTLGPILLSRPSNIAYRLVVNDAGILSTELA